MKDKKWERIAVFDNPIQGANLSPRDLKELKKLSKAINESYGIEGYHPSERQDIMCRYRQSLSRKYRLDLVFEHYGLSYCTLYRRAKHNKRVVKKKELPQSIKERKKKFIVLLDRNYTRDTEIFHGSYENVNGDEDISMSTLWRSGCVDISLGTYIAPDADTARAMATNDHEVALNATYALQLFEN